VLFTRAGECVSQNRILVIDIDPVVRSGICNFLIAQGFAVSEASGCQDAQNLLQKLQPHVVILDIYLPNGDVPRLLQRAREIEPQAAVVLLAGQPDSFAVRGIPQGADEVMVKPVNLKELQAVLARLLRRRPSQPPALSGSPAPNDSIDPFLGQSTAILTLREMAYRVLASPSAVLIQGETGSGKGVLAKWLHENGSRAGKPFLDLNCAGLSRELLESELFGYQKGAFTSAVNAKQGLLEVANGGTVFLDEIGDMDLQVQSKLLKVLEERMFRRLGDVRDRAVDVRLISATHRELQEFVRQQRFREDLYFRINIVLLQIPPLRRRVGDIAQLAQCLMRNITQRWDRGEIRISNPAIMALERYPWPGNIRELRNVLERAALITDANLVLPEHLRFEAPPPASPFAMIESNGTLKQIERAYIDQILHAEGGSVERAARRLGIPRSSLYNKMRRFQIPQGTGRASL